MKITIFPQKLALIVVAAVPLALGLGTSAQAITLYSNDFQSSVGSEWSSPSTSTTPVGGRQFLGEFGNETVSLTLNSLPAHSDIKVEFDLFVLKSWDGNNSFVGPDRWKLSVDGGLTLVSSELGNPSHPW